MQYMEQKLEDDEYDDEINFTKGILKLEELFVSNNAKRAYPLILKPAKISNTRESI